MAAVNADWLTIAFATSTCCSRDQRDGEYHESNLFAGNQGYCLLTALSKVGVPFCCSNGARCLRCGISTLRPAVVARRISWIRSVEKGCFRAAASLH